MRKALWIIPLFLGLIAGFVAPSESATTRTYTALMLPPSGSGGQSPALTCGFHGGSCGTNTGDYLDWDNTNVSSVSFRGIFKRSGAPYETNQLKGHRRQSSGGPAQCDIQDVAVIHNSSSTVLGYMRYTHVSTSAEGYFPIATSSAGVYNPKFIGEMTNDSDCGGWSGTHVHNGYKSGSRARASKNTSLFPYGDYCTPGINCRTYRNDSATNWTHKFTWNGS